MNLSLPEVIPDCHPVIHQESAAIEPVWPQVSITRLQTPSGLGYIFWHFLWILQHLHTPDTWFWVRILAFLSCSVSLGLTGPCLTVCPHRPGGAPRGKAHPPSPSHAPSPAHTQRQPTSPFPTLSILTTVSHLADILRAVSDPSLLTPMSLEPRSQPAAWQESIRQTEAEGWLNVSFLRLPVALLPHPFSMENKA